MCIILFIILYMTQTKDSHIGEKMVVKERKPYIISALFFVCILGATLWLQAWQHVLASDIAEIQADINQNNQQVALIKDQSSLVQVYNLLQKNTVLLSQLEESSDVVQYIEHVQEIALSYGIIITGFDYDGESIHVVVSATSKNADILAYQNIVAFLSDYQSSDNALFKVWHISSITGHDSMQFGVQFIIQ